MERERDNLLGVVSGELEDDLLAGQTTVDGNEGVELVLQRGRVLGIEEANLFQRGYEKGRKKRCEKIYASIVFQRDGCIVSEQRTRLRVLLSTIVKEDRRLTP